MTNFWFFVLIWFALVILNLALSYYQHKKGMQNFIFNDEVPYKLEPRDERDDE